MLTFKHQTWLKCQTSLQGLNASKCKVSGVPTDFNQDAASTREVKLSLQLCLPMKGQVGLQVLAMARLQTHRNQRESLSLTLTAFGPNPRLLSPTGTLYETQPLVICSRKCLVALCLHFYVWREESPLFITLPDSSRTCFHSLLLLTLCNTLGRNFPLQMFALGRIIPGKDQLAQFSSFSKASVTDRGALLSVSRSLPTSSLRSSITSHQWPKTCEVAIISRLFALLQRSHLWSGNE